MAENKAKVRFLMDRNGEDYSYKAGEVYELPITSCQRWVRRNVAEYVDVGEPEQATVRREPKAPVPDFVKPDEETGPKAEPKAVKRAKK